MKIAILSLPTYCDGIGTFLIVYFSFHIGHFFFFISGETITRSAIGRDTDRHGARSRHQHRHAKHRV